MSGYGIPSISSHSNESGLEIDDDNDRGAIVERFRKLEAAAARARPTVRSQIPVSIRTGGSPPPSAEPVSDGISGSSGTEIWGSNGKRQGSLLVAIALDTEAGVKKARVGSGSFYDCGVCWSVAKDPILTCCGHLFCWGCFCKLPYVMYPTMKCVKECPVCEGEVSESSIVPIYGDADSTSEKKMPDVESGLRDPPRPKARRVERRVERRSLRQQMPMARALSQIPVTEALNRIRTSISVMGQAVAADFAPAQSGDLPLPSSTRFSNSATSITFISSALNNAQRLVEDLETYRRLQRSVAEFVAEDYGDIPSENATPIVVSQQQDSSGDPTDE